MKTELSHNRLYIGAIFLGMFFLLCMQFSKVMVYFDDYGYYALSYGVENYTAVGAYSPGDLLEYLKGHYVHSNGRLLGFFVWLALYGVGGLQLVQVAAAAMTLVVLFLIWKFADCKHAVASAVLICGFYWLFPLEMVKDGTYWFAAFFHYVAPLMGIFGFLLLYFRNREAMTLPKLAALVLLIIYAAFSQEQLGATVTFMLCLIFIYELTEKRAKLYHVLFIGIALGCALVMMRSPGSLERVSGSSQGPVATIVTGTYKTIYSFFAADNYVFVVLLYAAVGVFSLQLYREDTNAVLKLMDIGAMALAFVSLWIYALRPVNELLGALALNRYYAVCIVGVPVIALIAIQIMRYYYTRQNMSRLILFCTAVGSVGCLCVLPEMQIRLLIPGWFLLMPLLLDGLMEWKQYVKYGLPAICAVVLICAVANGVTIYRGYAQNAEVHVYNHERLKIAAEQGSEVVYLKRLPRPDYAGVQPYNEGVQYAKIWMSQFYGLDLMVPWYFSDVDEETTQYRELEYKIFVAAD